jgi:hypothetical protein
MSSTSPRVVVSRRVSSKEINESVRLSTGRTCTILRVRNEWIPKYYLLTSPKSEGEPTPAEIAEMLALGLDKARELASEFVGDPEAFGVLYSGYSVRREQGWHVHIVLLGSRWRKAWLYFVLAGKNLLQAMRLRKDDAPRV